MGQYHSVINLDKRAGYSPRSIGSFIKAAEQGQSFTPGAALLLLLSDPTGWGGERIAIVGDYAEDADLDNSPFPASELWGRINDSRGVKNVGWLARKVIEDAGVATFEQKKSKVHQGYGVYTEHTRYEYTIHDFASHALARSITVYNHDKRERITPPHFGDPDALLDVIREGWNGGTATALTILLAASCKGGRRGGGDYDGEHPLVGSWAGDHISVTPEVEGPEGYTDISATLRDEVMEHQVWGVHYEADEKGRITRSDEFSAL